MDNLAQVLGIIGLIISIPTAIGAGIALVRASYNKAQTEQLRQHNNDLRARVSDVEHELAEVKTELAASESISAQREQAIEVLTEAVTQRADLEKHHLEVMANYDAMSQILGQILAVMQEVVHHVRSS
jgi:acetolactate synthase small subunit